MQRIIKYIFYDLIRTRFVLGYTVFLWITTFALFQLDSDGGKVVLSLLNIVLMVVPLVSVVFATIHYFNSYEFIELMVAQPVHRATVFLAEYVAVAGSLALAFLLGVGFPLLVFGAGTATLTLIVSGILLTLAFVSIAFLSAVLTHDKARAIGIALLFWFCFSLIYDGLVLWIIYSFNDYPLEKITLLLIALNPIDLARILLLLQLDISALMGFTGAFYQKIFGSMQGIIFSSASRFIWALAPALLALRVFLRKDI